jgi:ribosomal-protein-alanine N-acetyltransferase
MPQLQRLRADHGPEVLAFELANRAYFSASISDRGDAFFEHFDDHYNELLAKQETGRDAYYLLIDENGSILGRFNLVDIDPGTAELGYRVAQRVAGRGEATAAVREICQLAAAEFGLRKLWARTTLDNVASQRVLAKSGFVAIREAEINGQPAAVYERDLVKMELSEEDQVPELPAAPSEDA